MEYNWGRNHSICDKFFEKGKLTFINNNWITLTPKVPNLSSVEDYISISMVESLYKIISKTVVIRLKTVIGNISGESQSGIVQKRQILDGVVTYK